MEWNEKSLSISSMLLYPLTTVKTPFPVNIFPNIEAAKVHQINPPSCFIRVLPFH